MRYLILALLAVPLPLLAGINVSDKKGASAEIEVQSANSKEVTFTVGGQKRTMQLDEFSDESIKSIVEEAKTKHVYSNCPPLKAVVAYSSSESEKETESARGIRTSTVVKPEVTVESIRSGAATPALEATFVTVVFEKDNRNNQSREGLFVGPKVTAQVPASADGKRQKIPFEPLDLEILKNKGRKVVYSETFKHFIFALTDPETKKIVDFQTNYAALQNFLKANPDEQDRYLRMDQHVNIADTLKPTKPLK